MSAASPKTGSSQPPAILAGSSKGKTDALSVNSIASIPDPVVKIDWDKKKCPDNFGTIIDGCKSLRALILHNMADQSIRNRPRLWRENCHRSCET